MRDRAATYDNPEGERSMGKAVQAFNAITGRDLTEPEGWLLLQVLKDVRLFQRPGYHADSAEDCIAYAALKAEAKSSGQAPDADADGWIKWEGGDCPVPNGTNVFVRFRDGHASTSPDPRPHELRWFHLGSTSDIVAYRISPQHTN
jgi:hypothetical protein